MYFCNAQTVWLHQQAEAALGTVGALISDLHHSPQQQQRREPAARRSQPQPAALTCPDPSASQHTSVWDHPHDDGIEEPSLRQATDARIAAAAPSQQQSVSRDANATQRSPTMSSLARAGTDGPAMLNAPGQSFQTELQPSESSDYSPARDRRAAKGSLQLSKPAATAAALPMGPDNGLRQPADADGVSPSGSRTSTRLRKQASAWWQGEPGASSATPEVPIQLTHPDEGSEALHLEVAMQDASTAGKGSEAEAMPAGPDCKDGRRSRRGGSQVVKDTIPEGDESSLQDTDSGHAAAMPETAEDDSPAHGPTSAEKRRKGKGSRGGKKRAAPEGKGRAGGDGASQEEAGKPAKRTRRQTAAAQAKASSIDESLQPCDVLSPTDDAAASDPITDDPAAAGDTALGMGEDDAQVGFCY